MSALPPPTVVVEKTDAVDQHTYDAEPGSDIDENHDCLVPLEDEEDREDAEMGAQINTSARVAEEHNQSLQQGQDESAPASEPPATPAEPEFVKDDPSNWSEHLRLTYVKKKGKKREPVGYALPSGVQAIPGVGESRMHDKSGFEFNYSKEVKTGVKGRKYATSTTEDPAGKLLPKERKSVIDMDKLKKIGFDPAKHMEDPLFFLLCLFPLEDFEDQEDEKFCLTGFWDKVVNFTNLYSAKLKLGGDKGHKYIPRNSEMLIRWFGVHLMNGVLGGGPVLNRLRKTRKTNKRKASQKHHELMYEAMKGGAEEYIMTKRVLKFNDNDCIEGKRTLPDGSPNPAYDPAYKYTLPFQANQHNTAMLIKEGKGAKDVGVDEESQDCNNYGEPDSGVIHKISGKNCERGFQRVLCSEVGRARLFGFIHRHLLHQKLAKNTNHSGPNEAIHIIEQIMRMSKLHKDKCGPLKAADAGLAFPELYTEDPTEQVHFTADNHFQIQDVIDYIIEREGVGWLSTVQRGRMPLWTVHEVHKSKKGVTKATKAARETYAITLVNKSDPDAEPVQVHVSMQSTGETNFCCIRSFCADGVMRNWREARSRGRGEHKRVWYVEMNTARKLYLKTYGPIDCIDRKISDANVSIFTRRYHVIGGLRGFVLGVICCYDIYTEVYDDHVDDEDFDGGEKPPRFTIADFREELAVRMLTYTAGEDQYCGSEGHRVNTQKSKKARGKKKARRAPPRALPERAPPTRDLEARHVSRMSEYWSEHGVAKLVKADNDCYVCGSRVLQKCAKCDAPLCVMKKNGTRDCHARYHDPDYTYPLWVDVKKDKAKRAKWRYPSDWRVASGRK